VILAVRPLLIAFSKTQLVLAAKRTLVGDIKGF